MYVILFYDIAGREQKERNNANRIRKAVEKFLPRVQFSVYEGEIRESDFKKLSKTLQKEFFNDTATTEIYTFNSLKYSERIVIGVDKNSPIFS